jgi:oxygen-dependent protoporphyrinogen oxidase
MSVLVEVLAAALERTEARTGRAAATVSCDDRGFRVEIADGETVEADGVVLATPAFVTAQLVAELDRELARAHAEIPYASSVVITLAFSRAEVVPLDGYGYVVPRAGGGDVLACTWSSQKWEHRAPDEAVLLRVYAGRYGGRDVTRVTNEQLVDLAREEIGFLGVSAEPLFVRVQRWPLGMPQYVLGHLDRVERIERALGAYPGLAVAGAAYRGVGIPDCIASGEAAAESVARALAGAGV